MNKNNFLLLVSIFTVGLPGCAEVDSKDIKTSGIYTEISVGVEDNSTVVSTRLRTSRPLDADTIILSTGDQLRATMLGRNIALHRTDTDAYRGVFDDAIGGTQVRVALSRENDPGAPNSVVTLPNSFEITAPDTAESFNAGETITVVWSPADPTKTVDVSFSIDCSVFDENGIPSGANYGRLYKVVDSGTYTASINEILNVVGTQNDLVPGISCPFEVTVARISEGTLDSALTKGGTITATREKSVWVNVVP